jgi:hypothetical protein
MGIVLLVIAILVLLGVELASQPVVALRPERRHRPAVVDPDHLDA